MKFTTDKYCSYVEVSEKTPEDVPYRTREISRDVVADYSRKDGRLMGIEILLHVPEKIEDKDE
jgi:uncharacterized protein YuzE